MKVNKDFYQLLGLAYAAKKLAWGQSVFELLSKRKIHLVCVTSDISEKSYIRVINKCHYYHIDVIMIDDSKYLEQVIGKANVKLFGIVDKGFASGLKKKIKEE